MNVKSEAMAFRIWQIANAAEWNITAQDIADALGVSRATVGAYVQHRRWASRLRSTSGHSIDRHTSVRVRDAELEGQGVRTYLQKEYGSLSPWIE